MSDNMALRDPEAATILRRRALAERLMSQSTQQDFRHPLSIGATVAQSLAGALMGYQADEAMREHGEGQRNEASAFMSRLLGGGTGAPVTGPCQRRPRAVPTSSALEWGAALPPVPSRQPECPKSRRLLPRRGIPSGVY